MALNIEFITSKMLNEKGDKIPYILSNIKKNKILVLEEPLSKEEEKKLIESTMNEINQQSFTGIEIASLGNQTNFLQKFFESLGAKKAGLTVIGPANLVKEIKRDPRKLNLLAEE